ncbi:MAG: acyl-CoA thioesterase/BAAT N-terminal domain-containing protein [Chloroflexi bacterium]|nr:acyl-CoA thioesterase/BAAT N-terminal domain-containing protein [Chloroflexota bacterium]
MPDELSCYASAARAVGTSVGYIRLLIVGLLGVVLLLSSDAIAPVAWRGHAHIDLTRTDALVDETVEIRVGGLPPNRSFVVRADGVDQIGRTWESSATFVSDFSGEADLADVAPIDGDYHAADVSGLLWSMTVPGESSASVFRSGPPTTLNFTVLLGSETVASTQLKRAYVAADVQRTSVSADGLVGVYFRPPGPGPFTGVVTFGGSEGGLSVLRAEVLASHGYAALALGYFRIGPLPSELYDIPLEYFGTAVHWLQAQPEVRADRLVVMGTSRGGEAALLVGSVYPEVHAVVAYVPSSVMWSGFGKSPRRESAWSYQGVPLPFLTPGPNQLNADGASVGTPGFLAAMRGSGVEHATIPVERINGPVLLISGQDDQLWPSAAFSDQVMQRLHANGHPFADQHLTYPDTGHAVGTGVPHLPLVDLTSTNPTNSRRYAVGGTFEGTARALEDSWPRVLQFLATSFGAGPSD